MYITYFLLFLTLKENRKYGGQLRGADNCDGLESRLVHSSHGNVCAYFIHPQMQGN